MYPFIRFPFHCFFHFPTMATYILVSGRARVTTRRLSQIDATSAAYCTVCYLHLWPVTRFLISCLFAIRSMPRTRRSSLCKRQSGHSNLRIMEPNKATSEQHTSVTTAAGPRGACMYPCTHVGNVQWMGVWNDSVHTRQERWPMLWSRSLFTISYKHTYTHACI